MKKLRYLDQIRLKKKLRYFDIDCIYIRILCLNYMTFLSGTKTKLFEIRFGYFKKMLNHRVYKNNLNYVNKFYSFPRVSVSAANRYFRCLIQFRDFVIWLELFALFIY